MVKQNSSFGLFTSIFLKVNFTPKQEDFVRISKLEGTTLGQKELTSITMSTFNMKTKDPIVPRYGLLDFIFKFIAFI